MSKRDYYDILGVARSASTEDIRKAYRALARKLHPDVNKAPDAAAKFNEVQQAYDVLSDEAKRKVYDQFGAEAFAPGAAPPRGGASRPGRGTYTWTSTGGAPGAGDFDAEDLGDMFESIFGSRSGFGGGGRAGRGKRTRVEADEADVVRREISVGLDEVARGGTRTIRMEEGGRTRTAEVKIPRGVDDGAQLRMRGAAGGRDLVLTVRVMPHALFRRGETAETGRGLDLYLDLPLTIAEAALGATVPVPTAEGIVELRVPEGTSSGRKLRLRGKGLRDEAGREGDLYAIVRIVVPAGKLSEPEAAVLRTISSRGEPPRAGPEWRAGL